MNGKLKPNFSNFSSWYIFSLVSYITILPLSNTKILSDNKVSSKSWVISIIVSLYSFWYSFNTLKINFLSLAFNLYIDSSKSNIFGLCIRAEAIITFSFSEFVNLSGDNSNMSSNLNFLAIIFILEIISFLLYSRFSKVKAKSSFTVSPIKWLSALSKQTENSLLIFFI